jgi:hypothetical protein
MLKSQNYPQLTGKLLNGMPFTSPLNALCNGTHTSTSPHSHFPIYSLHTKNQSLDIHKPHTLSEASNAFFTNMYITFMITENKNTLKARYGVLWGKKSAYKHRTACMEGQVIARDTHCPYAKPPDSIGHSLGICTHSKVITS